ncbi:MAG: DNA gyrase inhibitor YacG [Verrucomicrobia bacterium]|nr:MAG: DNA gyrase inhibitor YacG [Verrucomicrobiota bacterium]
MTEHKNSLVVRCPKCRRRGRWFAVGYGPFCSERCKLIDMGRWFEEGYRISEPLRPDHFSEFENLPMNSDPDQPAS